MSISTVSRPALWSLALTWSSRRAMGGCGSTTPSRLTIPMRSFRLGDVMGFQGDGTTSGSTVHGFCSTTARRKSSISRIVCASGPALAAMPVFEAPGSEPPSWPVYGMRSQLGLMPNVPSHIAGILMLPPTSVPTPRIDPRMASRAPSPPELPPAVTAVLRGLMVRPKTLLCESSAMSVCGTFVLQYKTAPALSRQSTKTAFSVAGLKARLAIPMDASYPRTLKVSLSDMGTPWRGPKGGFPDARCASRSAARFSASWKKISVRQLVSWCAIAALCWWLSVCASTLSATLHVPCKRLLLPPRTSTSSP